MKQALTIAGSDPGGGAGIQADIKTFHANGVYGLSVVTAVTTQDTTGVHDVLELPTGVVRSQLASILNDFDVTAVKTGMLATAAIVNAVSERLSERSLPLVVDPVMVSTSGRELLASDAIEAVRNSLLPLATMATPNIPEAEILAKSPISTMDGMKKAAEKLLKCGCKNVLIKGGHAEFARATDLFFDGAEFNVFPAPRISAKNVHGTGCTLSAAITARIALGAPLPTAVEDAKRYVTNTIEQAPAIGRGDSPPHHFYFLNSDDFRKD